MKLDKQGQEVILEEINNLLKSRNIVGSVYLFGGNSLISQGIIIRTTKDVDFFLIAEDATEREVAYIKEEIYKKFKIKVDIGLNGKFEIAAKGFTWTLPKNAYARAVHVFKLSNMDVFALYPLDIVALKCDRIKRRDEKDMRTILQTLKPSREELIAIFEEYHTLLSGNPTSIENIKENFYQLVLVFHDIALKS